MAFREIDAKELGYVQNIALAAMAMLAYSAYADGSEKCDAGAAVSLTLAGLIYGIKSISDADNNELPIDQIEDMVISATRHYLREPRNNKMNEALRSKFKAASDFAAELDRMSEELGGDAGIGKVQ